MANDDLPDFSRYFGNDKLSDVTVILSEDTEGTCSKQAGRKGKQEQQVVLQCHGLVLATFSAFCRTKLESPSNWDTRPTRDRRSNAACSSSSSSSSSAAKHCIQMPVPTGQLEVGQMLIKAIYQLHPDLGDATQPQLLQLLLLADRYEVKKVVAAASKSLQALPLDQLKWDTVTAVYQLPAGCAELEACKGAYAAAAAKLQHELGDLELVWADDSGNKQQLLCGLPYAALKQLLQDPGTRVASENTVFYTIERWHQGQSDSNLPPPQLMDELVQLVRIRHCSQLFVATRMCESSLAQQCFSPYERQLACIYSSAGAPTEAHHSTFQRAQCPALAKYPAWSAEQRPASAMKQLTLDLHVPLAEVQHMVEEVLQDSDAKPVRGGTPHIWQGVGMQLQLGLSTKTDNASGQRHAFVGQFLRLPGMAAATLCNVTWQYSLVSAAGHGGANSAADITRGPLANRYSQEAPSWGYREMLSLGAVSSWAEAEAVLRAKQLVHADGCLYLRGVVTQVL